jgi:hypothetical protein
MRFTSATALAFAGALFVAHVHAAPQAMQDTSRKVPGGGITAPGWQGKVDAGEAAKGAKIEDSKVVMAGTELKFNNGPAAIYWSPANKAAGSYTVSATFTEPKYMSSNDHPHPYGLFIGGNKLDTDQGTFLYCTPYGNGTFIVRGMGPAPFRVSPGRSVPNEAVKKAETGGSVTQEVAWVVTPEKADCKINGVVVGSYPKADLVGAGKLESLDGIAGIRVAHNVDVNVTGFKVAK